MHQPLSNWFTPRVEALRFEKSEGIFTPMISRLETKKDQIWSLFFVRLVKRKTSWFGWFHPVLCLRNGNRCRRVSQLTPNISFMILNTPLPCTYIWHNRFFIFALDSVMMKKGGYSKLNVICFSNIIWIHNQKVWSVIRRNSFTLKMRNGWRQFPE